MSAEGRYVPTRVDERLTARQARAIRMVFDGLQQEAETVATTPRIHKTTGGPYVHQTPVRSVNQTVSWLLDRVADQLGISPFFPLE